MQKLFVGGLPLDMDTEEFFNMFHDVGRVESIFIVDNPETGDSKGFGFVEMPDEDAQTAIKKLNGKKIRNNKTLRVEEAKPLEND